MIVVSKKVYTNKLVYIVNKHSITYHSTIKLNLTDIKSSTYIEFNKEINKENLKFKAGDQVWISKYKNIFETFQIRVKKILGLKKLKILHLVHVISFINGEEAVGSFYGKGLQKTNQKEYRVEKIINKKADKIDVKWIGYDNALNTSLNTKDTVV